MRSASAHSNQTPPSRVELLAMLSNALPHLASGTDLFAGSTRNLLSLIEEMERAGYTIHAPFKAPQQHKVGHTTWLLPITTPHARCVISLHVAALATSKTKHAPASTGHSIFNTHKEH